MKHETFWELFLCTGSPEAYLLYKDQKRMDMSHVFDNTGPGASGHNIH